MVKKRQISSAGIAFSEKQDLRDLRKYAAKGWNVKRYKGMGYELEQGTPEDVIFSIDIRRLEADEEDEYFEMFRMSGWEHVCSNYNTHLFKAKPGTKKIYTDRHSEVEKLKRLRASIIPASIVCLFLTSISLNVYFVASGILYSIFLVIFLISLVLTVPCLMMLVSITYRLMRVKA